jgi:hypothetical protein
MSLYDLWEQNKGDRDPRIVGESGESLTDEKRARSITLKGKLDIVRRAQYAPDA